MTEKVSSDANRSDEKSDNVAYTFGYGHGRMPFFMKVVWTAFLVLATWYVVAYLLTSVGEELGL